MTQLEIRLLGTFQAKLDNDVLSGFRSDKARALLAYLVMEGARLHRRDWLAALLWGEYDDRSARRSLSSALANLRQLLGPLGAETLQADRNDVWIRFDPAAVTVDVAQFRSLLALTESHPHRSLIRCPACIERLAQAADLYVGPFLPGLAFHDSPAFEEWQRAQGEALHQQALYALGALTAHHLAARRFGHAEHHARRQISLQPWHEEAHRQLMMALAGAGQRNAALTQYDICRSILAADLSIEPEEQTVALFQRIRSGEALALEAWPGDRLANPYRGLQAFREADAADFYGREVVTAHLLDAVQRYPLVTLIGPSGSGKSSLLHAGLIHRLRNQADAAVEAPQFAPRSNGKPASGWTICEARPGSHPFHALAAAIAPVAALDAIPQSLELRAGQLSLADLLAGGSIALPALLGNGRSSSRLLLIVDQFEELWTLCGDADVRQRFIDSLVSAAASGNGRGPLTILLAVRADFMGQALSHRTLADALQACTIMLGPMNRLELTEAIVKPALAQGVRLQDGLAARIAADVGQAPGRLPLLEFALAQLWESQEDAVLTHAAYEAIGQVEGALASYAEQVYGLLSPAEQAAARRIFTAMVQLGQDTDDARRPLLAAEVDAADWALIQRLASQRLLVTDSDARGQQTAEIVHEALIHGWGRLRHWIDADRGFHLWQQRARLAAAQWLDSGQDQGALLRGAPLAEAEGWCAARLDDVSPQVQALVQASRDQREREEQEAEARRQRALAQAQALATAEHQRAELEARTSRRLRWLSASLAIVAVLAALTGVLAASQRNEALRQSALAQAAQAAADAERLTAEKEARLARSRQLAAQSLDLARTSPDLSILLALHAMRLNDSREENTELLLALPLDPLLGAVLHGQDSAGYSMAVSSDGRVLASGSENGLIWLWDLTSNQPLRPPLAGHELPVQALAFSPDGARLASGDQDGEIRIWDARNWQPLAAPLQGHGSTVAALWFDPTGQVVRSVSDDGTLRTWDLASGAPAGQPLALARPNGMAISADGLQVVSKEGVTLTVQSVIDGAVALPALAQHSASIQDVTFSPDGRLMASAGFDGMALLWDLATGQLAAPPMVEHDGRVLAVAFSPDGRVLASGGTDTHIRLWDVATGQPLGAPLAGHGNWVRTLAWTPDGGRLISGDAAGRVVVWDVGRARRLAGHAGAVRGLAWSADGRTLFSGSFDQTARARDVASGEDRVPPLYAGDSAVINIALSPDGRIAAVATGSSRVLRWDLAANPPSNESLFGHSEPVAGIAISPDSRIIASGAFDRTIRLWDAANGQPLGEPLTGHDNWVICLAFSPDGRTLASGSADATIRLWDVATGQLIGAPLTGHTGWVTDLAWSPDGSTLVSSSLDATVRFWDVASGRPSGPPLVGHRTPVWGVEFNPADGGRSLLTMGNDGVVLWWDAATRQILGPPLRSGVETESMALSPDGSLLAIGAFDNQGVVGLWRLPAEPWQQRACAIANRDLTEAERTRYLGNGAYVPVCPQR